MQDTLDELHAAHGEVSLSHVRVFAQLCELESGYSLHRFLDLEHFSPLMFTITIRHHDWWMWEDDDPLHIAGNVLPSCSLPWQLKEFRMELESLQRKKPQIDYIAREMCRHWRFRKNDDMVMVASEEDCEVSTWEGSSTIDGKRWYRDETKSETLEYYIKTVVWKESDEDSVGDSPDLHVPHDMQTRLADHSDPDDFEVDLESGPSDTDEDDDDENNMSVWARSDEDMDESALASEDEEMDEGQEASAPSSTARCSVA